VGGVRQQQYVLATPGQAATPVSQVIYIKYKITNIYFFIQLK
ncbi:hypothetical protein KGM_211532B, partial [Danaus plexippus plexippus]